MLGITRGSVSKPAAEVVARYKSDIEAARGIVLSLADILPPALDVSRLEVQRKRLEGAIDVDGVNVKEELAFVHDGSVIRVGKHRFLRIVDAEKP